MRRVTAAVAVAIVSALAAGCAQGGLHSRQAIAIRVYALPETAPDSAVADQRIQAVLAAPLPQATDITTLEEFVALLSDVVPGCVWADWDALNSMGVEREAPIRCDFRGLSVRQALELALADAGNELRLAYEVRDGCLRISTGEILARRMAVRIYDVRALLAATEAEHERAVKRYIRRARLVPMSDVPGARGASPSMSIPEFDAARELEQMLTQAVEPDSWVVNGGTGQTTCHAGLLTVRQSESLQRDTEALLRTLARALSEEER
ncbi:MAG: hypothetical protein KA383_11520 [Phycisphaerae bacterium]|nr:hypothetical protein [Phycisphaerae bacterium]